MDGVWSTQGGDKRCIKYFCWKTKERDHLEIE